MKWNDHSDLSGLHAPFSASKYNWVNYDDDKLIQTYYNSKRAKEGTELHEIASLLIKKRIRVDYIPNAFNMFVNDAIDLKMESERVLFYSKFFFGTTDAILYNPRKKELRIHDLKTGTGKVSFLQLDIYAALFCLEYKVNPEKLYIEERIYQFDTCEVNQADPENIRNLMELIKHFNKILELEVE